MNRASFVASLALSAASAFPANSFAQGSLHVVVPNVWTTTTGPDNNIYPFNYFSGGPGRYQQVYAAADFAAAGVNFPIQITELAFRPGLASSGSYLLPGRDLDVTITLSESAAGPDLLSTTFAANPATTPVVVYSGSLSFPTVPAIAGPGPFPWSWFIPLQTAFAFDGSADLLLDVAVNSLVIPGPAGPPAPLDAINASGDPVSRMFHTSNPAATTGFGDSLGLITRFAYDAGGFTAFGSGCPASGGFVPAVGSAGGLPMVGNLGFSVNLSSAPGNSPGSFLLGGSASTWIGIPLPWELLSFNAPGCFLLVSPDVIVPIVTSGLGPGTGTSSIAIPIPPVPSFAGQTAYAQWVILDLALGHPVVSDGGAATIF
jgi:hypothetical protein